MAAEDLKLKQVTMTLGGKVLLLQYDMFAFEQLESLYGNLEDALKALEKGSMKATLDIIWAGAVGQDPNLARADLGKNVAFTDLIGKQELLLDCIMSGMPKAEEPQTPSADGLPPVVKK